MLENDIQRKLFRCYCIPKSFIGKFHIRIVTISTKYKAIKAFSFKFNLIHISCSLFSQIQKPPAALPEHKHHQQPIVRFSPAPPPHPPPHQIGKLSLLYHENSLSAPLLKTCMGTLIYFYYREAVNRTDIYTHTSTWCSRLLSFASHCTAFIMPHFVSSIRYIRFWIKVVW